MKKKDHLPSKGSSKPDNKPVAGTTGESTAYGKNKVKAEIEDIFPDKWRGGKKSG